MKRIKILIFSPTALSTYYVFSGNIISAILAFLYTVLLVRNLSLADIGYFSALWSFLLLIADVAELGIGTSLSAFVPIAKSINDRFNVIKTAMIIQFVVALLFSLPIFIFSDIIASFLFHSENLNILVKVTSVGIFIAVINYFYQLALTSEERFLKVALFSISGSLFRLGSGLILVLISLFTLKNAVMTQVFSLGLLFLLGILLHRNSILKGKLLPLFIKNFLAFSSFLGIARGMTALASRLDVLMIVAIRGPTEAGIYAIAARVISLYPLLSGSFSSVLAPKIAAFREKQELIKFTKKVILATLGIIFTIIILIIIANPFMTLLFQEKGTQASGIFQVLLISMVFFVSSIPPVTLAVYSLKKPHILTINSLIQVTIVFLGNLFLIPHFGYFGAAYSLIAAYAISLVLTTVLTIYYLNKRYG